MPTESPATVTVRPIEADQLETALRWRYATKKFDPKRLLTDRQVAALEHALVLSPSSFGLQPWKFVVLGRSPKATELRTALRAHSWNQPQITDASHIFVLARRRSMPASEVQRYVDRIVQVRQAPAAALEDYKKMMLGFTQRPADQFPVEVWTSRQVYLALGVLLSAAATLGVDACPMEGIDPAKYDELLGSSLGPDFATTVVAAVGHRAADDIFAGMAKVRYETSQLIARV